MKITVLCPAFNAAGTIRASLTSVVAQGYEDYEVILADGGSSDRTIEIAKAVLGDRCVVLRGPDGGQLDGVLKAAEAATGDILFWLNADDLVMPGAFQYAASELKRHPDVGYIYSDNFAFKVETQRMFKGPTIVGLTRIFHEVFYRQLYSETVYFRAIHKPKRNTQDLSLRVYTDYSFFLYALEGVRGRWASRRLGAFRIVEGQASQKFAEKKAIEFKQIRSLFYRYKGWSPQYVYLVRFLVSPVFLCTHIIWPRLTSGARFLWRKTVGAGSRAAQERAFFEDWLNPCERGTAQDIKNDPRRLTALKTRLYR